MCAFEGRRAAGPGDGGGETWDESRRSLYGGLQSGVGGVLQSGPVPARTEPLHPSQSGQQEGPNRVYGEEAGGKIIICVFCALPLRPVDVVVVWLIEANV